jgi:centrosomal protein CEP78
MRVDPISKTTSDVPCDFATKYDDFCRQYHLLPLSSVKIKLDSGIIDLDTDTLRFDDWTPLCSAIGICKTLRSLTLRSQYYNSSSNNFAEAERRTLKRASSASKRPPLFQSKELLSKICTHIKDSLLITTELVLLELDGLPFRRKDLTILAQGIAKCKSLVHFRLTNSPIGDEGLDILCRHLNQAPKIREVDFSACSLTSQGAHIIADLIRQQGNRRHTDVWKESLRHQQKESLPYQNPMLDHMSGLRRVTLNRNPLLADRGATFLAEVIEADLWIKALDLQDCAISTNGAKEFLNAAKYNSLIHIIDIRNNPLVDRDVMEKLIEQLLINCEDDRLCEYKWLKLESPRRPRSKIARMTTTTGANGSTHFDPKTPIDPMKLQRSKSTGSVSTEPRSDGIPWRTAARASRLPYVDLDDSISSYY